MSKLNLLRQIVQSIDIVPLAAGNINQTQVDQMGFAKCMLTPSGFIGVRRSGGEPFSEFVDAIFGASVSYKRGSTYKSIFDRLFVVILEMFVDRRQTIPEQVDVDVIENALSDWFLQHAGQHQLYVPVQLSPWPAQEFHIGPITFTHFEEFREQLIASGEDLNDLGFRPVFEFMAREDAHWIATVEIGNCFLDRAREIADLAVDIALAGIQIVVPLEHSQRMSRATARTTPRILQTLSRTNGGVSITAENSFPGFSMGEGTLQHFLAQGVAVTNAVGRRVAAFIDGNSRLKMLISTPN